MALEIFEYRFHGRESAELVLAQFRKLCNADAWVERDPVNEDDRKRGIGDWNVRIDARTYLNTTKVSGAFEMAMQLALAEELRKKDPGNTLLRHVWHLREENAPPRGDLNRIFNVHQEDYSV